MSHWPLLISFNLQLQPKNVSLTPAYIIPLIHTTISNFLRISTTASSKKNIVQKGPYIIIYFISKSYAVMVHTMPSSFLSNFYFPTNIKMLVRACRQRSRRLFQTIFAPPVTYTFLLPPQVQRRRRLLTCPLKTYDEPVQHSTVTRLVSQFFLHSAALCVRVCMYVRVCLLSWHT